MPVIDFDIGVLNKVRDIYMSPGIEVVFQPDELFERRRIIYKQELKEVFPFISIWRSGFRFDANRWDPSTMFSQRTGHYNNNDPTNVTLYSIFPVKFNYTVTVWDLKRESIDFYLIELYKAFYLNPTSTVKGSEAGTNIQMRCYLDFGYDLTVTEEYVLEKEDKVPYFKGTFNFELEGWVYNYTESGSGSGAKVIQHVHVMYYNDHDVLITHQWVPNAEYGYSGQDSGECGVCQEIEDKGGINHNP